MAATTETAEVLQFHQSENTLLARSRLSFPIFAAPLCHLLPDRTDDERKHFVVRVKLNNVYTFAGPTARDTIESWVESKLQLMDIVWTEWRNRNPELAKNARLVKESMIETMKCRNEDIKVFNIGFVPVECIDGSTHPAMTVFDESERVVYHMHYLSKSERATKPDVVCNEWVIPDKAGPKTQISIAYSGIAAKWNQESKTLTCRIQARGHQVQLSPFSEPRPDIKTYQNVDSWWDACRLWNTKHYFKQEDDTCSTTRNDF